ncbi:MAG: EMC3/TMCO1 family protein [Methanomassiliicoccaceae archaeon]|nr:EMC3/TMCO1 family protein [Methanomassiliicoccaceae archaeon]
MSREGKPQTSQMMFLMISLMVILGVMMFMEPVGRALNVVLDPLIGFNHEYVVPTLMLAGILMIGISTVIRTIMMDTITQARNQKEMSAFNAELRKARIENNLYKIKKLTEQQKAMMSKTMESSMKMMKTLPITMLIIIPIFAWISFFLGFPDVPVTMAVPWAETVFLRDTLWFLPIWILVYMLISIPFGQILGRAVRWFMFKKRLEELDRKEAEIL